MSATRAQSDERRAKLQHVGVRAGYWLRCASHVSSLRIFAPRPAHQFRSCYLPLDQMDDDLVSRPHCYRSCVACFRVFSSVLFLVAGFALPPGILTVIINGTRVANFAIGVARVWFRRGISFRSQHSQQFEPESEDPVHGISQRCNAGDLDRSFPEEVVLQSSEQPEVVQEVPIVVLSLAWIDEVKTLKQGDIHVGKRSKQRLLLPSFCANRYKVSEFGRDRTVVLHRAEVREDPQSRRRVHELSGKRLLCHCRQNEKCHADNLRDLFRQ